ncbi:MAG: hypothetical protein M3069_29325 [Chloroflexota bacterium]|nr:hypothetical protein [Chloroflexota bacterium]
MQVNVPSLNVQQASLQAIDVGQARIGPITVGDLVVRNTDLTMAASQILLRSVSVFMRIHFVLVINVHVGLPDGIPDIDEDVPFDLGTVKIPPDPIPSINIGDVTVPTLTNIQLHIPTLLAQNMSVNADPLAVHLNAATAQTIHATNAALPVGGFTIAGLTLNSVSGNTVSVPDAKLDSATIAHLTGTPASLPAFGLKTLALPTASVPDGLASSAPLNIPAQLSEFIFTAGRPHDDLVSIALHVTPFAQMHVDHLDIASATASASAQTIELHNVTLPYDVLNLTLSQIGITTVEIPTFTIS